MEGLRDGTCGFRFSDLPGDPHRTHPFLAPHSDERGPFHEDRVGEKYLAQGLRQRDTIGDVRVKELPELLDLGDPRIRILEPGMDIEF